MFENGKMSQKQTRREAMRTLWTGAKATAGIAIGTVTLDSLVSSRAIAMNNKGAIAMPETKGEYPLTVEGQFNLMCYLGVMRAYKEIAYFLRTPEIINNRIIFEENLMIGNQRARGSAHVNFDEDLEGSNMILDFKPLIKLDTLYGDSYTLLHELGHCWFAYMDNLVDPDWVTKFDIENKVNRFRYRKYSSDKKQLEAEARLFAKHISGERQMNIFDEGFMIYNEYIENVKGDPRRKYINLNEVL